MEGKTYRRNVTIASLSVFAVLFVIYFLFHQKTQYVNADCSAMFQVAIDFLDGNYLLENWVVNTCSYTFTDTIWCIPGILMGIHIPTIMSICGALFHAGFVSIMLFLILCDGRDYIKSKGMAIAISLIYLMLFGVIPYSGYAIDNPCLIYLNLFEHDGSYLFVAIEMLVLYLWRQSGYKKVIYPVVFTIYGVLGQMSDNTPLMVLYGPLCIYSAYFLLWPGVERNKKKDLFLICDSIGIVIIASLLNKIIETMGGMTIMGVGMAIMDDISAIIGHLKSMVIKVLLLFGYDNRYGLQINAAFILACLVSVLVAVSVLYQAVIAIRSKPDRLGLLLALCVISNAAGFVFINTGGDAASRYIMGVTFFGTPLVSKFVLSVCGKNGRLQKALLMAVLAITSVYGVYHIAGLRNVPRYADDGEAVAAYIREKGGGPGFGSTWVYTTISAYTDFDSTIIPVWWDGGPYYYRHTTLLNTQWYDISDVHYVVVQSDENDPYSMFGVGSEFYRIAGKPDEDVVFGVYEVLYYENLDLTLFEHTEEFEDEYLRSVGLR